jgi:hypothetical protein
VLRVSAGVCAVFSGLERSGSAPQHVVLILCYSLNTNPYNYSKTLNNLAVFIIVLVCNLVRFLFGVNIFYL